RFELTDENGHEVDESDYDGARATLLYFGYTNCPDICPMTLARISRALADLDDDVRDDINVLFVSVDPDRDTPEKLQQYTAHSGPQIIGLTGTRDELTEFTHKMRVTYGYGEPNERGYYEVSHSSAIFIFDHEGKARLLANQHETVDELTQDIRGLLRQTGQG